MNLGVVALLVVDLGGALRGGRARQVCVATEGCELRFETFSVER